MTIRTVKDFPRKVKEIENFWIPMSDGVKLAARMWLPKDAEKNPVPAVLEYIPYRKRDGTIVRDALTHPYLAGHGYAAIRVDMRGNGDSEGLMHDEYAKQEQDDALEAIAWIARQKWSTGKVGMMGISWGGFNALQVAARKPRAQAIDAKARPTTAMRTIHYKGGCLINGNPACRHHVRLFVAPARSGHRRETLAQDVDGAAQERAVPDRALAQTSAPRRLLEARLGVRGLGGDRDAGADRRRLERCLFQCHPAADEGAAHDAQGDHRAVGAQVSAFRGAGTAHRLPQRCWWWDQWLKGEPTGVSRDPDYRVYVMDAEKPGTSKQHLRGRWIGENSWGFGNVEIKKWHLNEGAIGGTAGPEKALTVSSKQTTGLDGGEYCIIWLGPEFPGDQKRDDAQSLVFDSPALVTDMDIVGQPAVELDFSVDKPVALVAVRLNDVWPSGEVSRITYHVQNLCMRDSREYPKPLEPGKRYKMKIKMDDIAWRIPKGHKLRVSISTSYFPIMWPAPEPVTLTVHAGKSLVHIPVRKQIANEAPLGWKQAEAAAPARLKQLKKPWNKRDTKIDAKTGEARIEIVDDFGAFEIAPHGLITHGVGRETYAILPTIPVGEDEPLTEELKWPPGSACTEPTGFSRHQDHWIVWGKLEAFEAEEGVQEGMERGDRAEAAVIV
jgi:predicted acyl esterase